MTPRRILLLIGGMAAFAAAYHLYTRAFGGYDGLPVLPTRMLLSTDGTFRPPLRATSPTIERLKLAFGENSPETVSANYPTQLEFRNADGSSTVLASGSPPANPRSNRVTLSPFSVASFGKPKPEYLRTPGEVVEISTVHSDKAVLEFDREIVSAAEMSNAKLVRLEMISDPEQAIPDSYGRRGIVHITNNRRSADANEFLVMKTVGPVFYRDANNAVGPEKLGPDMWTDAPVEIADRSNLPHRPNKLVEVAVVSAEDVRKSSAVAAILSGQRLPPPTVTAIGMRIYLEDNSQPINPPPAKNGPKTAKSGNGDFGNIRRIEFLEQVLMNLWVEAGQGLVGPGGKSQPDEVKQALLAVCGAQFAGLQAARELGRDLLQVETRGPFFYDAPKNLARFDVLPVGDPNLTNDVRVTKVPPTPGTQSLFSQVLELEFLGSPTGTIAPKTPNSPPRATKATTTQAPSQPATPPATGGKLKRLHAWTYTPNRFLTISSDRDQLEAYGQDLVREQDTQRTLLTGAPLYAVSQRNVLTAGGVNQSAVLILEPAPNRPDNDAKTQATVFGPGRVELFDAATNTTSTSAHWRKSMVQTKEKINNQDVDLYTFTEAARFEDLKSDFWLNGNVLKLWLTPKDEAAPVADGTPSRTLPHRLQAIGNVTGHSADLDIEQAEQFNTLFRDIAPPDSVEPPLAMPPKAGELPRDAKEPRDPTLPREPVAPTAPGAVDPKAEAAEPAKPKPPMKLRARTIDAWVVRYPMPKLALPVIPVVAVLPVAGVDPTEPEERTGGLKYQLEKARCEGMVSAHQDPADPAKPRGTDIIGSLMLIDSTPDGSILTVFGWEDRPGEVHNEGTSLIGPKVLIDQLHNLAIVEGRGSLAMPSSSDLAGADLKKAEVVVIHFRDGMTFRGALKIAEFFGKVNASQGGQWVTCHTMQVNFDRPIYFSQMNQPAKPAKPAGPGGMGKDGKPSVIGKDGKPVGDDKPKIDVVFCYPAPADTADNGHEKLVTYGQVERDPLTDKPIRRQQLIARGLTMRAQVRDMGSTEPYKHVLADGPGILRIWQPGSSDDGGDDATPKQAGNAPAAKAKPADAEMKLTVIEFTGRMTAKDKGKVYQEATFLDQIKVVQIPTEDPDAIVDRQKLPPRSTLLTCNDKLVVWSHKTVDTADAPAIQHMHAFGNAYSRNDDYDGWGETIKNDGKLVIFDSEGVLRAAQIKSRFGGNEQAGKRIIYDRATKHYKVEESIGGTIFSSPSGPRVAPQPALPLPKAAPPKK